MDKQELIDFLKEQLNIDIFDDGSFITVKIMLGDEIITEDMEKVYR